MFCPVWITYNVCYCGTTWFLLRIIPPPQQGRHYFRTLKNPNKPIFALANEVTWYANYNILLVKFKSIPILWTNTTWAFTCPVRGEILRRKRMNDWPDCKQKFDAVTYYHVSSFLWHPKKKNPKQTIIKHTLSVLSF